MARYNFSRTYESYLGDYNKFSTGFDSGYDTYNDEYFKNPFNFKRGGVNADVSALMQNVGRNQETTSYDRSGWKVAMDTLMAGTYASAGFVKGTFEVNDEPAWDFSKPFKGAWEGLKAGNPFGGGNKKGEVTYSDVLATGGWNPTSTGGKIAKGATGFVLDVALDPTTYLTGGLSAVIKGTGRTAKTVEATAKMAEEVARATRHTTRYDDLVSRGVNPDLATRVANKGYGDALDSVPNVGHMTDEMAESLIKYQSRTRNVTKSSDELSLEATRLADQYNKMLGIRNARGAGDVTWGVGNMPFAPKAWEKYNVRLGSQEGLQKVGDAIGMGRAYSGLRKNIYGRQIGKLLSNKSPLYKLAHEDPAKLWDSMEYVQFTKGLKGDKLTEERKIREYFSSLKFDPAESKEIIKLLEDKTIWHKVAEKAKFMDLEKAREVATLFKAKNTADQAQLQSLIEKQNIAKTWKDAVDNDLMSEREMLKQMQNQMGKDLLKMDIQSMSGKNQLNMLLKHYTENLTELETRLMGKADDVPQLNKLFEESKLESEAMNAHMAKSNKPDMSELNVKNRKQVSAESSIIKGNTAPGRQKTLELKESLSRHIFGEEGKFVTIGDNAVTALMKEVQAGKTPRELQDFVDMNPNMFSPHMREVNEFVAKELNYRAWHKDGYKEPLGRILGKSDEEIKKMTIPQLEDELTALTQAGKITQQQGRRLTELHALRTKRRVMRTHFEKMTEKEFATYRRELENERLMKDFYSSEDGFLDLRRSKFINDDASSRGAKTTGESEYTGLRNLTNADVDDVVSDMVSGGLFTKTAIEQAGDGLVRYIGRVVDEVDNLSIKEFNKSYMDMSDAQRVFALKLAVGNVATGKKGVDKKIAKRAQEVAIQRAQSESVRAIIKEAQKESTVLFKLKEEMVEGAVKVIRTSDNGDVTYIVKTDKGHIAVPAESIKGVKTNSEMLTPEGLLSRSDVHVEDIARKENILRDIRKAEEKVKQWDGNYTARRKEALDFYNTRIKEQEGVILKLEADKQQYDKMLRESSPDEIAKLQAQIAKQEEIINNNSALETWMRSHSQADVELLKDPMRYSRNIEYVDDMAKYGEKNSVLGFASGGKIFLNKARYDELTPKDAYKALKVFEKEMKEKGWSGERIRDALNTSDKQKKTQQWLKEHELSHVEHKDYLKPGNNDYSLPNVREYEARANDDALKMVENFDVDKMLRDANPVDAGRIWLDERASSAKIAETVRILRHRFDEMGRAEVSIGKLTDKQFEGMLNQYVPHVLTPDGQRYFDKMKELGEHGSKVTGDLGYGTVYNPFAKSRTTLGKSVDEINEHFREALKGKNLFSENIADIYLTRAMKHTELMYDDNYMKTMMNVFGKDIPVSGKVLPGYKAVMNYGMMKKTTADVASMRLSTKISNDVSSYLSDNFVELKNFAKQSGKSLDKLISDEIDMFLKDAYPESAMRDIYEGFYQNSLAKMRLPKGIRDEDAMPMMELDRKQIHALRSEYNSAHAEHTRTLQSSLAKAYKRGDNARVNELMKRFDKLAERTPPQLKQVNDAIVSQANQARQLQRAKDQSQFLQMYDKFLYFMKLNQTVVSPAFHARNKYSNMYQDWLGTGRDAFRPDWQMSATLLARFDGDPQKVAEYLTKNPKWKDRMRPITLDNVHPSLQSSLNLNNGQLHWQDAFDLALQHNVLDIGVFAREMGAEGGSKGLMRGLRYRKKDGTIINFDPTDTSNFIGYKMGTKVGTSVENGDRLIHFVSQLRQGKSVDDAAYSSRTFLFDYGDLTGFEQSVMKRIFPYYTWLRKNARLQVSQLIENPEKFRTVAKIIQGIEHTTPEEERLDPDYVPDWADGWITMPWKVEPKDGKAENVLVSPAMPFMDLNRIPNPMKPAESIRELLAQTAPMIKNPVEIATNTNSFFGGELIEEGENPVTGIADHLTNQFAVGNILKGFGKDNPTDVAMHANSVLTGVKANSFDYEMSRGMALSEEENDEDTRFWDAIRRMLKSME